MKQLMCFHQNEGCNNMKPDARDTGVLMQRLSRSVIDQDIHRYHEKILRLGLIGAIRSQEYHEKRTY